jgi:2,3-dihydroxybenzoate-AMP ligase
MLAGATPWDDDSVARYLAKGYWEGRTIADMVRDTARRVPERTAVVAGGVRLTYAELVRQTERLAFRLLGIGIRGQDRVVLQLPNVVEFVPVYLALVRIGAIPVMALRVHRQTEIRHFIDASGASAYVVPDQFHGFDYRVMAESLRALCPTLERVLVLGEPGAGQVSLSRLLAEDVSAATVAGALRDVRPDPMDVATMLLSGGTTSVSKLIPRTHNDYVLNARCCASAGGFSESTVYMAMLPLAHNYNLASPGMLGTFYHGGTLVICPSGEAEVVFPLIERERVTVVAGAVPLITGWLNSEAIGRFDLSSLEVVQNGGARLAPELRARVRRLFHCTPQEIYGTAEGLINMTRRGDPDELLLESSGAPVCDEDEIRVVDDAGNDVADGTPGELVTRGPYTIRGYFNAPEKNREAFTADGFYRMGDIVRRRGRYVYAEGRRKDLINRGGEKISCEEVENLVLKHPDVKGVSLVAMPDEVFGEKACAFVILKPGAALTFGELVAFLRRQDIASFKLPERLEIVPEFPLSPVGKILKSRLREHIAERLASEKAAAGRSAGGREEA